MIIVKGFRQTFRDRFPEWVLSIALFWWGIFALVNPDSFQYSILLSSILRIATQEVWGWIATVLGSIRIIFLIINGAWRPSAHIRTIGAILGSGFWSMMILSSFDITWLLSNSVLFIGFLAFDLYSLWFSAEDAKLADLARRT